MSRQQGDALPSNSFFIRRLIAYQPLLYVINATVWILYHGFPLVTGLVARMFFDTLQGKSAAGFNLPTLVALVAAVGLARVGVIFGGAVSGVPLSFRTRGLLQRNLIAREPGRFQEVRARRSPRCETMRKRFTVSSPGRLTPLLRSCSRSVPSRYFSGLTPRLHGSSLFPLRL